MRGATRGGDGEGTPGRERPALRSCGPAPPAFNFWEGAGRAGGKTGLLEPATRRGGGWELEEMGMEIEGLGRQILQPTGLSETLPRPPRHPRPPGSETPCSAGGEQGVRGGQGGHSRAPVSKPCQTPAGGETAVKGAQGRKLPLCWAKGPWNGGLQPGWEVRGLRGGLGWAHPHGHPTNWEQRATQSTDKAGARTWAGTGSAWPGALAGGEESFLAALEAELQC